MLFTTENVKTEDINKINNFFAELDNEFDAVKTIDADAKVEKTQKKLQKAKLKRIKNMAKSTNPWSSAYSMMQLSGANQ